MYEDKLKEKLHYDKEAVDSLFSMLSSMVDAGSCAGNGGNSTGAVLAVLSMLHIKNVRISAEDADNGYLGVFDRNGIIYRPVELRGKWWHDATGPLLTKNSEGDLVALLPGFLGYYRIYPATGKKVYVNSRVVRDLDTTAMCFSRELPRRKLEMKDLYHYILRTIQTRNIFFVVFFCLLVILLGMLVPVVNKFIFNDVIPSGDPSGIFPVCSFLLGVGLSMALFELTRNLILNRIKDKYNANLQAAIMARVYSLPYRFFKEYSAGDLSVRALSANSMYQLITNELLAAVAMGLFSTLYIFIAFVYAKSLVWMVTLTIAAFFLLFFFIYRYYSRRDSQVLPNKAASQGFVYSLISGIHKIRNNGAESRAMSQWAKRFTKSELVTADAPFIVKYQKALSLLLLSSCTIASYYFAWKSGLSISDFIAFNAAFGVMLVAFDELHMVMVEVSQLTPQLKLIGPILDAVPESLQDAEMVDNISGELELSNVTFRYSINTPDVLKSVSLKIHAGENVGVVGLSGCGKSSLMRLMMGFEMPDSGSVFYGKYNLAHTNLNSLHKYTGYCPQEKLIFPDTIMNNIRLSAPMATEEEVWHAAWIACIDEDIRLMPDKMQTMLGEGGSGLSGGQCQRIMIARAVLNNPKILFFDEATSALDNLTQKQVVERLSGLKCTRISIAHRLSTIEHCDRIIVLDKGVIVEDGSPEELYKKQGFFYKLARRQQL